MGFVTCSSRRWVDPASPLEVPPLPRESGPFCSLLGTQESQGAIPSQYEYLLSSRIMYIGPSKIAWDKPLEPIEHLRRESGSRLLKLFLPFERQNVSFTRIPLLGIMRRRCRSGCAAARLHATSP